VAESVNIRITGKLKDFIAKQIGLNGLYESASEYIRDLIRRDYELHEDHKWTWLYNQLKDGMTADDSEFDDFDPEDIVRQAKKRTPDEI
jgi:antitoxin ParD1/3/4